METKLLDYTYKKFADILIQMIPEDWKEILLYAEYREGFSQVYFYYYTTNRVNPAYSLDIIDLFDVDKRHHKALKLELYQCFEDLWQEFKVQDQEPWTSLTYLLDNTGKMKIDYTYEDLSQLNPIEKQEKWEARYLLQQ